MRKKLIILLLFFGVLAVFLLTPYFRSVAVAFFYKEYNLSHSTIHKNHVFFQIPSGTKTGEKDWFPLMVAFHDEDGFSSYTGRKLDLTVFYTYGDFNHLFGTSSFYDPKSPYYGAFYGGYAVLNLLKAEVAYGFDKNGNIIPDEVQMIPEYDMKYLVLPALGCPVNKRVFEVKRSRISRNINYIGYKGWTRIDAVIMTNGPAHSYRQWNVAYWQYGRPLKYQGTDFDTETFYGRTYVKFISQYHTSFFLYIICKDKQLLEKCDKELLSKSKIGR